MAFIYNLTDNWTDVNTTWNGIKLAVTNTSSDASSKLLNLTVTGATTASFVVDKNGNLALNGTVNKVTFTAPATGATLTLADGSTFATSGAFSTTLTTTGTTALTLPTSGTVTALGNATTGSGSIVLATSPTLTTPNLGTPTGLTLTNATGLPTTGISNGALPVGVKVNNANWSGTVLSVANGGTGTSTPGLVAGTNVTITGSWPNQTINATGGGGGGSVTSVSASFTGGLVSVSGSPITSSGTLAFTVAGTSGGIPYFSSSSAWASTGILASGALLIGGGAGGAPSSTATGTGVVTALGVNVGSAGAIVVQNGALGTPSSGTLTNATGLPLTTGVTGTLPIANGGTGITSFGVGVATALGQNVTGSGGIVLATSPSLTTPNLGTPSAATLTNATGLPISTGVSGLGTGVATALAVNVGSAGSPVVNGGALGTPSSGTLTNATGLPVGGITATGTPSASTYLRGDGSWQSVSASPGGSNTQVQFNNSGAFGGSANFTFDSTNAALTVGGATVITSNPVLNLTQTWNAGAVTFTGLKFNATDTASAAGSRLLDLQVGGASKFRVTKGVANVQFAKTTDVLPSLSGTNNSTTLVMGDGGSYLVSQESTNMAVVTPGGSFAVIGSDKSLYASMGQSGFGLGQGGGSTAVDTILTRAAAATLQLGAADAAAPVAQTLQVQSVVAGTTNTAGASWTLRGSRGTGTGAGGSIIFQVAPAGSSGTAQNAYATRLQIDANNSSIQVNNQIYSPSGTALYLGCNGYYFGGNLVVQTDRIVTLNTHYFGWSSDGTSYGTADVRLYRDAANTLALRNGTSAQKFRVYNTYTSSTNYENFEIDWQTTANIALVGPTKGSGGGTQRVQRLQYLEDGGTGSTTPSLGTTCPAASATIKSWIKVITSDGTTAYIPCWA